MKRILSVLVLVAVAAFATSAMASPAKSRVHAKHRAGVTAIAAVDGGMCSGADLAKCGGSCPLSGATAAMTSAKRVNAMPASQAKACPANASNCPSGCSRGASNSNAVAVSVTAR